jgi:tRNA threonylcarbamoyladenosine biosynthesis protein TsaE
MLSLAAQTSRRYKECMNESPQKAGDLEITLGREDDTLRLAAQIWQIAQPGDVIALWGDLGAGKTAFARGFIQAATSLDEEVPSPTFTLLQTYESPAGLIHHFDLYRIEQADEVLELGIEDAFADGITLIEWPGNMGHWLPRARLDLELTVHDNVTTRTAKLTATDPTWQARLADLNLQG